MLSSGSETLSSGKRFAEFDFDSKILFNLWGWLWPGPGCHRQPDSP
ncbi:hypothetical protein LEP1GSC024_3399 [Leptospira noguchii str. 2001034031]|uniref:Uncharacterized protein n=1 Tax=Leptospira noguchii str. 2001034031 TaxID=1193053 RepID=M6XZV3_9LEPT|nr:hypothetical protein LEP1GSC024_3399 [Leptospira noguchii str. 2001034031]